MKVADALEQLKNLTSKLEEIAEKEADVEIEFNVEEYWIDGFGDIKRVNYSVKERVDYKDLPHYYEVDCDCHC